MAFSLKSRVDQLEARLIGQDVSRNPLSRILSTPFGDPADQDRHSLESVKDWLARFGREATRPLVTRSTRLNREADR